MVGFPVEFASYVHEIVLRPPQFNAAGSHFYPSSERSGDVTFSEVIGQTQGIFCRRVERA
jgi:hypothetical protein